MQVGPLPERGQGPGGGEEHGYNLRQVPLIHHREDSKKVVRGRILELGEV